MQPQEMISEAEACERLRGMPWLVSHGGVASEALCAHLGVQYPEGRAQGSGRPIRGAVAHFPYPLPTGPSRCVYVYGSVLEAILSQLPRHYDNPAKLHNDEHYPRFYRVEDLLDFNRDDPFGITAQFDAFCQARVDYPILMVKYEALDETVPLVCDFLGIERRTWEKRPRASSVDVLDPDVRLRLWNRYGELARRMDAMPSSVLIEPKAKTSDEFASDSPSPSMTRFDFRAPSGVVSSPGEPKPAASEPESRASALRTAGVPASAELVTCWSDLVYPSRRLGDLFFAARGVDMSGVAARVKQPSLLLPEDGDAWLFLNLRYDFTLTDGYGLLCGFRVCPESYRPLDQGRVIEVPVESMPSRKGRLGPEDQRVIRVAENETYSSYNMLLRSGERGMFLCHLESGHTVRLRLRGRAMQRVEKNWMPFAYGSELRFVYRIDPITIVKCDPHTGNCDIVYDEAPEIESVHGRGEVVHGGSELHVWRWPYFIGFVHSCAPWRLQLAVLDVEKNRWVFVGPTFDCPKPDVPEAEEWRGKSVQFPASVATVGRELLVGVEYEDRCPALVRMPADFVEAVLP